jgi:hypothetical protein
MPHVASLQFDYAAVASINALKAGCISRDIRSRIASRGAGVSFHTVCRKFFTACRAILVGGLVRLRHKPDGDSAHAMISGKKQPILQSLKRRVITGFLQFVTQSY